MDRIHLARTIGLPFPSSALPSVYLHIRLHACVIVPQVDAVQPSAELIHRDTVIRDGQQCPAKVVIMVVLEALQGVMSDTISKEVLVAQLPTNSPGPDLQALS